MAFEMIDSHAITLVLAKQGKSMEMTAKCVRLEKIVCVDLLQGTVACIC